jgi:hypothetical protein
MQMSVHCILFLVEWRHGGRSFRKG